MKPLILVILFSLAACGKDSSPEGRMGMKIDHLNLQIDSLKQQNALIMDSLSSISKKLQGLKEE